MCGRYTLTRHENVAEDLEAALEPAAASDAWWRPRWNIAPTQPAPVVIAADGARTLALMRWGLVPHWAGRGERRAPLMINARRETLEDKAWLRDALAHRRCLVPTDGFFEWVRAAPGGPGKPPPPQPFYFHPPGARVCAFAGLWTRARDEQGRELRSFTIITAPASALVQPIHDRMPAVLAPADYAAWLDPAVDVTAARALLEPADDGWLRAPVSTRVNKVDHDDAACVAPAAAPPPPAQGRLFD